MLKKHCTLIVALSALAAWATAAPAPEAKPAAQSAPSASTSQVEDWLKKSKQPTSWWKLGGDLRLRHEYLLEGSTLNAPVAADRIKSYERFRARFWSSLTLVTNVDLNVRLTAEPRLWWNERTGAVAKYDNERKNGTGWDWTEGIIDNLNFSISNMFNQPMSLKVGRQDIALGDPTAPWLVADGTPLDGSRTYYFDAIRWGYKVEPIQTMIDAMFIDQYALNDRWLPPINGLQKNQIEQNERGAIVYLSNKSLPKTQVDGFFMYKHDHKVAANGNNSNLYTSGGRVAGDPAEHWRYNVEGAWQVGDKNNVDVDAFSVNSSASYLFKDSLNNSLRLAYEYSSGDDPKSKENEEFDPLWGRYPRWSELYIYSFSSATESRPSQIANFHRIGPGWTINPFKKADFLLNYYYLLADQNSSYKKGSTIFTKDGGERGHLLQAILKYKYNSHLAGHLWSEFLFPGNYYAQDDMLMFLRAEVMLSW